MALDQTFFSSLAKIPMDVFNGVSVITVIRKSVNTYDPSTGDATQTGGTFTTRAFKLRTKGNRTNTGAGGGSGSPTKAQTFVLLYRVSELTTDIDQDDIITVDGIQHTIVRGGITRDPANATLKVEVSGIAS